MANGAHLLDLLKIDLSSGPLWSMETEDLDCTYVSWLTGQGVAAHRNAEVDVVMIVVSGRGVVTVDGEETDLSEGRVVVIPKNAERAIRAVGSRLAYLNVHKRRRRLMPGNVADRPR